MNTKVVMTNQNRIFGAKNTFAPHLLTSKRGKKFIAQGIKITNRITENSERKFVESQKPTCSSAKIVQAGSWVVESMLLRIYSHCDLCGLCEGCSAPLPAWLGIVGHVG